MKKSRFLTFLLALVPGCGLMYLGYMKKGLQTMAIFAAAVFFSYFFGTQHYLDWVMAFFLILLMVVWFYQLFDSMHAVSRMKRMDVEVPDDDGFYLPQNFQSFLPGNNRAVAKVAACLLIFFGVSGLAFGILDGLYNFFDQEIVGHMIHVVRNNITPAVVSLVLIAAGVRLLRGSKKKIDAGDGGEE